MMGVRAAVAAALLGAGFTWGMIHLFGVEFSAGDFYPEYSSLRSDPPGTKLLFDSLSHLPGMEVSRNYLPLEYVNRDRAAVLLFGLGPIFLNAEFLQRMEQLARRGNRVVVAMAFERRSALGDQSILDQSWHIQMAVDPDRSHAHPLFFAKAEDWLVRENAGAKILAVERGFGQGSVLFLAESGAFRNDALIVGNRLAQVSTAIGPSKRVIFDERHFGIAESGSLVGLARRFRLMGLAMGLAIVLALALWKNASGFPPPIETRPPQHYTGRTSFEGLVTLLRRHLRPNELVQTCWEEWLKSNRHEVGLDRAGRAAALAGGAGRDPLEAVREIQAGLHAKGEL